MPGCHRNHLKIMQINSDPSNGLLKRANEFLLGMRCAQSYQDVLLQLQNETSDFLGLTTTKVHFHQTSESREYLQKALYISNNPKRHFTRGKTLEVNGDAWLEHIMDAKEPVYVENASNHHLMKQEIVSQLQLSSVIVKNIQLDCGQTVLLSASNYHGEPRASLNQAKVNYFSLICDIAKDTFDKINQLAQQNFYSGALKSVFTCLGQTRVASEMLTKLYKKGNVDVCHHIIDKLNTSVQNLHQLQSPVESHQANLNIKQGEVFLIGDMNNFEHLELLLKTQNLNLKRWGQALPSQANPIFIVDLDPFVNKINDIEAELEKLQAYPDRYLIAICPNRLDEDFSNNIGHHIHWVMKQPICAKELTNAVNNKPNYFHYLAQLF